MKNFLLSILIFLSFNAFSQNKTNDYLQIESELIKLEKIDSNPRFKIVYNELRLFSYNIEEFETMLDKKAGEGHVLDRADTLDLSKKQFITKIIDLYTDELGYESVENIKSLITSIENAFANDSVKSFYVGRVLDGRFWEPTLDDYYFALTINEGTIVFRIKGYM